MKTVKVQLEIGLDKELTALLKELVVLLRTDPVLWPAAEQMRRKLKPYVLGVSAETGVPYLSQGSRVSVKQPKRGKRRTK